MILHHKFKGLSLESIRPRRKDFTAGKEIDGCHGRDAQSVVVEHNCIFITALTQKFDLAVSCAGCVVIPPLVQRREENDSFIFNTGVDVY